MPKRIRLRRGELDKKAIKRLSRFFGISQEAIIDLLQPKTSKSVKSR